jgi:hypothetical protein
MGGYLRERRPLIKEISECLSPIIENENTRPAAPDSDRELQRDDSIQGPVDLPPHYGSHHVVGIPLGKPRESSLARSPATGTGKLSLSRTR